MSRLKIKYRFVAWLSWLIWLAPVQAEQWDIQFKLQQGEGLRFTLCRDYVDNWERYITQHPETTPYDLSCRLEITPESRDLFRRPSWKKVDRRIGVKSNTIRLSAKT